MIANTEGEGKSNFAMGGTEGMAMEGALMDGRLGAEIWGDVACVVGTAGTYTDGTAAVVWLLLAVEGTTDGGATGLVCPGVAICPVAVGEFPV